MGNAKWNLNFTEQLSKIKKSASKTGPDFPTCRCLYSTCRAFNLTSAILLSSIRLRWRWSLRLYRAFVCFLYILRFLRLLRASLCWNKITVRLFFSDAQVKRTKNVNFSLYRRTKMLNLLEIFFLVILDAFISLVITSSDQLFFCFEPLHWCSRAAYDISREIRLQVGCETSLRLYTKKKIFVGDTQRVCWQFLTPRSVKLWN